MERRVRVRFAPSPTGPLHIGGVRTALYNYLFAKKYGGDFILRIEDTDSQRFVPGAEAYINEALDWCGIEVDEGVQQGGAHEPYRQSERREIYLKYALELVASSNAYYAFDKAEDLTALREKCEAEGGAFAYNYKVREQLETSLNMSPEELQIRIERGDQYVIRFKMPENEDIHMTDMIRGEVTVNSSTLDDKVLYKSADALPTYHLANIVDDHLMEISHVIRGEEWLPSLPLHYMLYRALGWSDTQPEFAHLPLLLKPTGKGKLSKRDGDKMGFPVFPLEWVSKDGEVSRGYREDGYFDDAFINMLALLGWNPGNDQEIMNMEQLIELFSLDRVGKSGARFDPEKSKWFNMQYMHMRSAEEVAEMFMPILIEKGVIADKELVVRIVGLVKDRATFVSDLWDLCSYMFVAPVEFEAKAYAKFWKGENPQRIERLAELLTSVENFEATNTEHIVHEWIQTNELPMGQVMNTLRLVVVGESKGPSMFDICEIIGKQETLKRIAYAIEHNS